jgi:hypothetical protein
MFPNHTMIAVLLLVGQPPAPAPIPLDRPKLTYEQKGSDLVVAMTVTVNGSPHALWTNATVAGKDVRLRYYVFQNRDLFTRNTKKIKVEWRLSKRRKDNLSFRVQEKFEPDSAELNTLLPQLARLKKDEDLRPPPPPCHPGCFPAGTMVLTPNGSRRIEKIDVGDLVLDVGRAGKPAPVKVASVFVGKALLVEVQTEKGRFLTTTKQPFLLSSGELKSAGNLTGKDAIARWQDGRVQHAVVHGVKMKDTQTVYNLVLEVRGTFVANGYLAQSKPPAEK